MKHKILFTALFLGTCSFGFAQTKDAVLLTINDKPVYQSEFEYIYSKNNTENTIDKKSLDEYMDLFINFKLKVAEAEAHGIDTTAAFINELAGYRKQLTKPYLIDKEATEKLIQEAYDRKKTDVEISHIAIQIPRNATAADTLEAYNKIMLAKQRITTGIAYTTKKGSKKKNVPEDFTTVAKEMSADPSVSENGGYIGWISPFRIVYSLENAAYNTPVGEISDPVRSPFGYHIIKVNNRRPTQGEVHVAHIMIFTEPDNTEKNATAKLRIDSLYKRVMEGDNFAELATKFSEDRGTATQGGELPWFGTGRMVPEFETAAFALQQKGDIAAPIRSAYGWHIIKLLDKRDIASLENSREEIQRNIERDDRNKQIALSFTDKLKKEYNYQLQYENMAEFYSLAKQYSLSDSIFKAETIKGTRPLFRFADQQYTQTDFANYLAKNAQTMQSIPDKIIDEKLEAFVSQKLMAYAESQLENKYTDFRNLMKEYHDGILLFEISNQEVWERASKDVEGITKFFNENRENYAWDKPHYKGRIIYCKDKATMKAAQSIVKRANSDSIESYLNKRLNDSIQYVKTEKGLYVEGDSPAIDKYVFKTGDYLPAEEYPYIFTTGKMLKKLPEAYTDVRGSVTADYQEFLEKEWLQYLRNKYKVEINQEVFNKMK